MNKIKSIIVDDEKDSRETLHRYLNKYCPQVTVLDECSNIIEAQQSIKKHAPQLLFLDIEMPKGNAFDLLEQVSEINFEVVFITAFSQYAIQAFNMSAAQYLLKPVNIEELEKAVHIVHKNIEKKKSFDQIKILLDNINEVKSQDRKLVLPLMEGFDIVRMSEVLFCEAEDNFTNFYFKDGNKQLICRNLKFYEKTLSNFGFCRIHRSFLVNLDFIKRYNKGKGGSVLLENGKELSVSSARKPDLIAQINDWVGR